MWEFAFDGFDLLSKTETRSSAARKSEGRYWLPEKKGKGAGRLSVKVGVTVLEMQ